jgi:hypothetical protein
MSRICSAVALFGVAFSALAMTTAYADDSSAHEVCIRYGTSSAGSGYFKIYTDASGTTFDRYNNDDYYDTTTYPQLHLPITTTDWAEGVEFAMALYHEGKWPTFSETTSASWEHDDVTREDTLRFNTSVFGTPVQLVFRSTDCADWNNCPGAAHTTHHCFERTETCCGQGTMGPKCVPKDTTDQCCTWFLASTTCKESEVCCGGMGPGASSYASCCDAGSTCCHTRSPTTGSGTCCAAGTTCCAGVTMALCCKDGETCNDGSNTCMPGDSSSTTSPAPVTTGSAAPSSVPATSAPTSPPASPTSVPATTSAPSVAPTPAGSPASTPTQGGSSTTSAPSGAPTTTVPGSQSTDPASSSSPTVGGSPTTPPPNSTNSSTDAVGGTTAPSTADTPNAGDADSAAATPVLIAAAVAACMVAALTL